HGGDRSPRPRCRRLKAAVRDRDRSSRSRAQCRFRVTPVGSTRYPPKFQQLRSSSARPRRHLDPLKRNLGSMASHTHRSREDDGHSLAALSNVNGVQISRYCSAV
ncbi:hypothetical protein chiPu_0032892, partial [Chiloscyllium punctatum]|nr:hypothetical protein [Chiloscyllium punctatum]